MLVLSRKPGESIVIDGRITVTINRVSGNRVTVGIDAPSDVHILRGELNVETHEQPTEGRVPLTREANPKLAGNRLRRFPMTLASA